MDRETGARIIISYLSSILIVYLLVGFNWFYLIGLTVIFVFIFSYNLKKPKEVKNLKEYYNKISPVELSKDASKMFLYILKVIVITTIIALAILTLIFIVMAILFR